MLHIKDTIAVYLDFICKYSHKDREIRLLYVYNCKTITQVFLDMEIMLGRL